MDWLSNLTLEDRWSDKQKLITILATTKELLSRSTAQGWPDEDPVEIKRLVDETISHLLKPANNPLPEYAIILFTIAGPIQEIALSNGWHDTYLLLATEYDNLAYLLTRK
ncbi:hypothetical protein [Kiloniella antarctica]|uniref:Uncharacterized protein n=1 Tax=Kiloniella antarctica TaxID=1550907 RepID=A0ABW5BLJ3_9PROT